MAGDGRRVSVLGVPTSAGSHNPGQDKAPAAWRAAGLIGALQAAGLDVEDRGDLPATPYRPVEPDGGLRDTDRVAEVARRVATEVASIRAAGRLPLVLGGDCTITLGALDGFGEGGLVYFDGDADLTTPERSGSAVADTMGMTHMLGGGSPRLARLGSRYPLLRPDRVVLFGFDPAELDTGEWTELASRHLYAAPAPAVRADPAGRPARPWPISAAGPVPTWCTSTWTCCTPGCSRWPTSRTSPGSPWTRRARAWTSSPAGRGSAGW